MTNEKEKTANHDKNLCFSFEQEKQIYQIISSNLWIAKRIKIYEQ